MMCDVFSRYCQKLKERDERISGFSRKFLLPRIVKSLILIPSLIYLIFILFQGKKKTIIYRPNQRNLNQLMKLKDVLVVGSLADRAWAARSGFSYFPFYPLYSISNFGLSLPWVALLKLIRPKRIIIWTDFGLDQFLAISVAKKMYINSWCVQHGLFPVENNSDLDGFDTDGNIVSSEYQKKILIDSNYRGRVIICSGLFGDPSGRITADEVNAWRIGGKAVVFVGAGYSHNPDLEKKIVDLLKLLLDSIGKTYKIIYRPHPRDLDIKSEIKNLEIECISDSESSYKNFSNIVFLGIKSTFLIEAQNAGKLVFLIEGNWIPRYFESGEIHNQVTVEKLNTLEDLIETAIHESLENL
jgi:hypothetical protein